MNVFAKHAFDTFLERGGGTTSCDHVQIVNSCSLYPSFCSYTLIYFIISVMVLTAISPPSGPFRFILHYLWYRLVLRMVNCIVILHCGMWLRTLIPLQHMFKYSLVFQPIEFVFTSWTGAFGGKADQLAAGAGKVTLIPSALLKHRNGAWCSVSSSFCGHYSFFLHSKKKQKNQTKQEIQCNRISIEYIYKKKKIETSSKHRTLNVLHDNGE